MYERGAEEDAAGVWICRVPKGDLLKRLADLQQQRAAGADLPLFGLPFAVKDNIDVAGMPTTAACPAFAYTPERSAVVVERLTKAGAIVVGKTNLDQFATGLVGVRSPYGAPRNPFDRRYIPGGSSSGSAVAVATGMVAFALGTDTAGSGRVPAAFNNIVGLKPSRGLVSTTGIVPACRSLDCVSVFALSCADAWRVFSVACHFDPSDPFARSWKDLDDDASPLPLDSFRFGLPSGADLEFFGDRAAEAAFFDSVATLRALGGRPVEIDFAPFREAAQLLYDGPWVAERLAAAGKILRSAPDALDSAVLDILRTAQRFDAESVFRAQARLGAIHQITLPLWRDIDVLVTPTAPTIYTVAQVQADPLRLNSNLGFYTNFVNLLDLCALAVPAGFRADHLPFGITLMAPRGHDAKVTTLGARYHAASSRTAGASSRPWTNPEQVRFSPPREKGICLAVVGAHLSGEPLNHQLTEAGATLVKTARTAPRYRLFALDTIPAKPGLVRDDGCGGSAVELEIWELSVEAFGSFVASIPPPLCVGSIELNDGEWVHGFLCENHAVIHARDISVFGGWRAYCRSGTAVRKSD
jgi:allophanate hydrolase